MKQYYFISGLPRSGSTLLSSILKQNSDFYADIASPVNKLVKETINVITNSENNFSVREDQRKAILLSLFEGFYFNVNNPIIFDTSRAWTASTSLLKELFPYTKILCCVREISWILNSFENISAKNCFYTNILVDEEARSSVETRCQQLMDPEKNGIVIKPWYWLQEGLALNPDMIYLVDYNKLCKNPKDTMKSIYNFLDKPYFDHDFNNVSYKNELFDQYVNMKDLHTVKNKVEWKEKKCILPNYVIKKYSNLEFWQDTNFNYD